LNPAEQADLRTQRIKVESLTSGFSNIAIRHRDLLNALAAGTAVLLAIACVNLMGLLLARIAARDQEIFVRLSLGATGGRLARQLVIEGLVLSTLGTAAGVLVAWWGSQGLTLLLWQGTTSLMLSVTPDARVLRLTVVVAITITLLIGALPAWIVHRRARPSAVRTVTRSTGRWSKALLMAQVALTLVLLFTAGLFASSLSSLRGLDSGVRAEGIRWTRLLARPGGYRNVDENTYYPEMLQRLAAVPGIDAAAFSHHFPSFFNFDNLVTEHAIARTGAVSEVDAITGMMEYVSPGFFETIEIPLLQGRDVTWGDHFQSPAVAVVNEALSKRLFPGGNALGQRIRIGDDAARAAVEIIGIVPDATMGGYRATHQPVAFRPKAQEPRFVRSPVMVFRTRMPPASIDPAVAKVVSDMGREYVRRTYSLEEQVDLALNRERLLAWVSSAFGGLAALAACVGLFSLLAYSVVRRTREIGVRMALGASRSTILAMVLREGLVLTLLGVGIGIPIALAAGRLTASMLFGVSSSDPMTLGGSIILFVLVSVIATAWPAVRASAVAPAAALRCE
jgi:predicted permease